MIGDAQAKKLRAKRSPLRHLTMRVHCSRRPPNAHGSDRTARPANVTEPGVSRGIARGSS